MTNVIFFFFLMKASLTYPFPELYNFLSFFFFFPARTIDWYVVENVPLSPPPGATPDTARGGRRGGGRGPTPGTQADCGAAAGPP